MRDLFVGDRVKCPDGEGYVVEVTRWRDRVIELEEYEAREFSERCRCEIGPPYREEWGRVAVRVGSRTKTYPIQRIEVIEGRDIDPNPRHRRT